MATNHGVLRPILALQDPMKQILGGTIREDPKRNCVLGFFIFTNPLLPLIPLTPFSL